MIDVQSCAVREDGVGEVRFYDRRERRQVDSPASVQIWRLAFEVPVDARATLLGVGVDDDARRRDGIKVRTPGNSVLRLDAENFRNRHGARGTVPYPRAGSSVLP